MQALPPPPPAQQCVKAADTAAVRIEMFVVASGDPSQVEAWLATAKTHPGWIVDADAQSNGTRFVRLRIPRETPYRVIGGTIYDGHRRQLTVTMNTQPPICEAEED